MIGAQFRQIRDGAIVTVTGSFSPETGDDDYGWIYRVEGEEHDRWIRSSAVPVRWESLE